MRKNYRHIRKWAKRTWTNCFRVYDRDIGAYPLAIDYYDGKFCIHYFSKSRDEETIPTALQKEAIDAVCSTFNVSPLQIYWKTRFKREKREQYEKSASLQEYFTVLEYGVKFQVNLQDYLDTGLFLDHRETRQIVAKEAIGKRLLNLFAYTCSFSVHAAVKGAAYTKSVDMSNRYTQWGRENFDLNGIDAKSHPIIRADCLQFLDEELNCGGKYGVIVIDPPTISRSKKMRQMFDVQIDYPILLRKALLLLAPGGVIFFSTNLRTFQLDESLFENARFQEISQKTLPIDFHDPKIHRCWKVMI